VVVRSTGAGAAPCNTTTTTKSARPVEGPQGPPILTGGFNDVWEEVEEVAAPALTANTSAGVSAKIANMPRRR